MKKIYKILIGIIVILLLLFLFIFKSFCPLFENFPEPTGTHSVGVVYEHLKDPNLHYEQKERNEFNIQIFYPSNSDKSKKYPYQPEKISALKKILPQYFILPFFVWNSLLSNIYCYAQPYGPIANSENKFPLIIYLPGIGSEDLHNLYLEELASHGYIIVAIEPPMDILVTVFSSEQIVQLDPTLAKAVKENNREEIYKYRDEAHKRWSKYIEFAISKLKELNEDKQSLFYQKLDLDNIGVMGHSHGGAVALDFCQKNKLCRAGINMDGWTKTYNSMEHFDIPFLFMLSEGMDQPGMQELLKNNQRPDYEQIVIEGAEHGSFSDGILQKNLRQILGISKENYNQVRKEISKKNVSFFDKYLKKQSR
jgi:dienelactone hydrolase